MITMIAPKTLLNTSHGSKHRDLWVLLERVESVINVTMHQPLMLVKQGIQVVGLPSYADDLTASGVWIDPSCR